MEALPSLWFGTDICQPIKCRSVRPSGVANVTSAGGAEPLKNRAMSTWVSSGFPGLFSATVTTSRGER